MKDYEVKRSDRRSKKKRKKMKRKSVEFHFEIESVNNP